MSTDIPFDNAILTDDLAFPTPNTSTHGHWATTARLGMARNSDSSSQWYWSSYREAARTVWDKCKGGLAEPRQIDMYVAPLVFLWRQHFELLLKDLADQVFLVNGDDFREVTSRHFLCPIWQAVERAISAQDDACGMFRQRDHRIATRLLCELDEVDHASFAFRYPTSKPKAKDDPDSRAVYNQHLTIDLDSFVKTCDLLSKYLEQVLDGVLGVLSARDV